jgi:hypothetical protein
MFRSVIWTVPLFCVAACAQDAAAKQATQERLAAVKQSMAENQAKLRQYTWVETTEISLKGEVKKREQKDCKYGPDGKVQKTAIAGAAPPPEKEDGGGRRGRRGGGAVKEKIIENKVEDMKEYMEQVAGLVHKYVPPDPQAMQSAFQGGRASLDKASGALAISDYAKPGDKVTLTFDPATKKLLSYEVATSLDSDKDAVSLVASFSSLPDGTNYLSQSVLDAKAKNIRVQTTNAGHKKVGM